MKNDNKNNVAIFPNNMRTKLEGQPKPPQMTMHAEKVTAAHTIETFEFIGIIKDGKVRRKHVKGDKAGTKNAWSLAFGGDSPFLAFGGVRRKSRQGVNSVWLAKPVHTMTPAELLEHKRRLKIVRKLEAEFKQKQPA